MINSKSIGKQKEIQRDEWKRKDEWEAEKKGLS